MSRFALIVKAVTADSVYFRGKKKKGKKANLFPQIATGLLMAFFVSYMGVTNFLGVLAYNTDPSFFSLYIQNMLSYYILYYFFFSSMFSISAFFSAKSDAFLCLPIKGGELFFARFLLSFYLSFFYGGIQVLVFPALYAGFLHLSVGMIVASVFYGILMVFVTNMAGFLLGLLLSAFIPFRTNRNATSVVSILLSLFGGAVLAVSVAAASSDLNPDTIADYIEFFQTFSKNTVFLNWVGYLPAKGIYEGKALECVFSFLVGLFIILLTFLGAHFFYLPSLGKYKVKKKKTTPEEKRQENIHKSFAQAGDPFRMQAKRERRLLFRYPSLFLNGIVSPTIYLVCYIITLIMMKLSGNPPIFLEMIALIAGVYSIISPVFSFSSLSLEKREIALLKTMPFDNRNLFWAKLSPSLLLYLLFTLVSEIAYLAISGVEPLYFVLILFVSLAYVASDSLFGFLMGCIFPNFNWDNPAEIPTRGTGVWLIFAYAFLAPAALSAPYITLLFMYPTYRWIALLGEGVIFVGLSILFLFLSKKRFAEVFDREDYC